MQQGINPVTHSGNRSRVPPWCLSPTLTVNGGIALDFLTHNREAWNKEVREGNIWTRPASKEEVAEARQGDWHLVLTPTKPVPKEWFPDLLGSQVLCLASGGGQQSPILAAAGACVTVMDNSPGQLNQDKMVAMRDRLQITTELGDMRDLGRFADASFDLVFHPVSNCFVDNVNPVWQECFRVLKRGGTLLAGFCNPLVYLFDFEEWDNNRALKVRYRIPYSDVDQLPPEQLEARMMVKDTLEFGHSLEDQIGGQVKAGFLIAGFYEDVSGGDLLDPHIPTFIATRALKP